MDKTLTPDNDISFRKDMTDQIYRRFFVATTELITDSEYFDGPVVFEPDKGASHRIHQGAFKPQIQNLLLGVRQYFPMPVAPGTKAHPAIQNSSGKSHQKNFAVVALRKYSRSEQSIRVQSMVSKNLYGLLPAIEPVGRPYFTIRAFAFCICLPQFL